LRDTSKECKIQIHVSPGSKINKIQGISAEFIISIKLTAPAIEGKANSGLIRYLSEVFGMPKSRFTLERGDRSRDKLVKIRGLSNDDVLAKLKQILNIRD
jgi:hypothetical protein